MDSIDQKICYLAENLLVKGEFLSWRRFSLSPLSNAKRATKAVADIKIDLTCNKQSDRIVVEKIIATSIIDSHPGEDNSTIYIVEVLAAVSNISSSSEDNESMIVNRGSIHSYENSITFTICCNADESFVLLDVMF